MSRDTVTLPAFSDPDLRDSIAQALAALGASSATLAAVAPRQWETAASMGWLAAFLPEAQGGLALGLPVMADLAEQAGRHLFCGPLWETVLLLPVLAGALPELAPLLEPLGQGALRLGYSESPADDPAGLLVEHAGGATHLLHVDGPSVSLARLDPAAVTPLQPMDPGCSLGRLPQGVGPEVIARARLSEGQAAAFIRAHHIAVAADLLGSGEAALARTLAHLVERRQFGGPIGRFQGIKHRMADLRVGLDVARLSLARALEDDGQTADTARIARVQAAEAARAATAAAVQYHGGLGFSWEMDLHLWLKRVLRLNARAGGTLHLKRAAGDRIIAEALAATA